MSWVTAIWSALIGGCLVMALPHFLVGIWQRRGADLFFVLASAAVIAIAIAEMFMMRATSVGEFARAQQSTHVPIFILVVALVGFVRLYFRTGRRWLGLTVIALRFVSLVINFNFPPSLNFREITALRSVKFLGEAVSTPIGVFSPWTFLAELSSLLLLVFVVDASISLWKKGTPESHRRALVVGGSITFFILLAAGVTALIHRHVIVAPYLVSFPFAAILVAMAFELGSDLFRAGQVAQRLQLSEASLSESEERVALAAEAAQLGVWELDLTTNMVWVSEKVRSLFQIEGGERIDYAAFQSRLHPEDRAARDAAIQQAIETKGSYEMEFRVLLADGTVRWIAGRARYMSNGKGKATRLLGVSMDVTKRKAAEEEARQRREQVELLSRASLLGEMTASLAHELNQPLSAITTNANAGMHFIEKGKVEATQLHEIFHDVAADSLRAHEIIQNVRSAIKKGSALHGLISVNHVVETVAHMMQPAAAAQFCTVEMALAKDLPPVEGDPNQLQQALINLVTNAFQAMRETPAHRRKVHISTSNGHGTVSVGVRDHGHGIAEAAREHLFEQFFTTKQEGLGMGLAIVRSIVEAHGGKVMAENASSDGARFCFDLPVSKVEIE